MTPKCGGDSKGGGKEPDEGDVDGVGPWAGHNALFTGKVPFAVLHEEVVSQEQEGEWQEEEEAIVKVSVADAISIAKSPVKVGDFRVQSEGHTQGGHQNVPDRQVDQQVVARGAGAFRAQTRYNK